MDPAELHATKYYLLKMAIAINTKIFDLTDFVSECEYIFLECEYISSFLF